MQPLSFERLEPKQLLTNYFSEVLTSEDLFIFRGEERPTPSPVTTNQWAYELSLIHISEPTRPY